MTVAEKVRVLQEIFRENSNQGVLTWGPVDSGYRWNCENHATAVNLAEVLMSGVGARSLDCATFPFRIEPAGGSALVFEPIAHAPA